MDILITGATGLLGRAVINILAQRKHTHIFALRHRQHFEHPAITWVDECHDIDPQNHIDLIINLAGAPIDRRWTNAYRQRLIDSRVHLTANIIDWIDQCVHKPKHMICASAMGYYGQVSIDDHTIYDENTPPQMGFTHDLCAQWEAQAMRAKAMGLRVCVARFSVVLSKKSGALAKMLPAFKLGLGGKIGIGKQPFSWVHHEDAVAAIMTLVDHPSAQGIFNVCAPQQVSQMQFAHTLAKILKRPTFGHLPTQIVELIFGQMGRELLLHGVTMSSEKLIQTGFVYRYPTLNEALHNLIEVSAV